jgi:hypothetical protein
MAADIIARLDEINRSAGPYHDLVLEAGQLMESFAQGPHGLAVLIERYGASVTPSVANPLSFLLARKAEKPTQRMAQLVLNFIERFQCWAILRLS